MPRARGAWRGRPSSPSRLLPDRPAPHAKNEGGGRAGPVSSPFRFCRSEALALCP